LRPNDVILALAAGAAALAVYLTSGPGPASYDSAPNSLLAFELFEHHRLDFDDFRGGYFAALGGGYAFVEAPDGQLAPVFPIGTAIVTLPIYGALELGRFAAGDAPPIASPAFEPLRRADEQLAAALVAALSVALCFLCAREIAGRGAALAATAVYAFATSMWSTASQALWQHGPVNAFVLATAYALFRSGRAREAAGVRGWLLAAGACAGLLPVIRPTAALFSLAAAVFVFTTYRQRSWWFAVAAAAAVAPGIAWNAGVFHSLFGGYDADAHAYALAPLPALVAFAGLLVSPSRGLFVFSPVLAFAAIGAVRAWRAHDRNARLVALFALAGAALAVQYAFFRYWWAGYAYGPRFLTDIAGVAALALAYAVPKTLRSPAGAAFALTFAYSVAVQFAGTDSGAAGSDWNAIPVSVDRAPQRVWSVVDNQIERNVRAAYVGVFAWNVARTPAYLRGLRVRVFPVVPAFARAAPGSTLAAQATVTDEGPSRAYGYDSGVYVGQLRVRVRVLDGRDRLVSEQALYVRGSPARGGVGVASGMLMLPAVAGTYALEADPVLVGIGPLAAAGESAGEPGKRRGSAVTKEVVR
jgi:4-amino-4-deoxy-L-arabinose transferase-like glycosyltransferase